jgi:hypothetical protein
LIGIEHEDCLLDANLGEPRERRRELITVERR